MFANSNWGTLSPSLYVERAPNATPEALQDRLNQVTEEHTGRAATSGLRAQPITEVRYDTNGRGGIVPTRNPSYLYVLIGVAAFVLLIASINFMTLSVGRSATRAREVGVRKTAGARRGQLMAQFWSEAFLLCGVALLLGIGLAEGFHPVFQKLVAAPLPPIEWSDPVLIGLLVGLLFLVGLVSGSYPALHLSRFHPMAVLRGESRHGGSPRLVRGLVVLQFVLSTGLIIGTLVMERQMDLLQSTSLGFDQENVVRLDVPYREGTQHWARLRTALSDEPRVQHVAGSWNQLGGGDGVSFNRLPVATGGRPMTPEDEEDLRALQFGATPNIVETLGLRTIEGQSFAEYGAQMGDQVVLVNRAFVQAMGWKEPVGRRVSVLFNVQNARIIGVVEGFHVRSLHHPAEPLVMSLEVPLNNLYVRLAPGDLGEAMDRLKAAWEKTMPDLPFQFVFLDEAVQQQYRAEERWARTVRYAAGFALFIACLGLLGLAHLAAQRRTKEVGIRKALGATEFSVVGLLVRDVLTPLAIAFTLAVPVAFWAARQWLQAFAYRIELGVGLFLLACGIVLAVSLLTVGVQAWQAARLDPATTLRDE